MILSICPVNLTRYHEADRQRERYSIILTNDYHYCGADDGKFSVLCVVVSHGGSCVYVCVTNGFQSLFYGFGFWIYWGKTNRQTAIVYSIIL